MRDDVPDTPENDLEQEDPISKSSHSKYNCVRTILTLESTIECIENTEDKSCKEKLE